MNIDVPYSSAILGGISGNVSGGVTNGYEFNFYHPNED